MQQTERYEPRSCLNPHGHQLQLKARVPSSEAVHGLVVSLATTEAAWRAVEEADEIRRSAPRLHVLAGRPGGTLSQLRRLARSALAGPGLGKLHRLVKEKNSPAKLVCEPCSPPCARPCPTAR